MNRTLHKFLICLILILPSSVLALNDQGLVSIMTIIDKAIEEFNQKMNTEEGSEEDKQAASENASNAIVSLSRTLGKLSYSRLQCGQAEVLAEFTKRVQTLPTDFRDPMRDAFQQGFDQSKEETPLLSQDECERLTQSRTVGEKEQEANVEEVPQAREKEEKVVEKPKVEEDPQLKHLRVAELSGQLAYKRKFCGDDKVVTRDFNEVINRIPEQYRQAAKESYWKGYKHGKRLNKNLTREKCL